MESILRANSAEVEAVLRRSLALELPYAEREAAMAAAIAGATPSLTPAAVLVLIGIGPEGPALLLTRRTENLASHKGQVAFPGGMAESGDVSLVRTALRESHEEIGLDPSCVMILGSLPALTTVTGFRITPVLGFLNSPLAEIKLVINSDEVADAVWLPLRMLLKPESQSEEIREYQGQSYPMAVFEVEGFTGFRIWGATAAMLKNLLDRLHALG